MQGLKQGQGNTQQEEEEGWVKGARAQPPLEIYVCPALQSAAAGSEKEKVSRAVGRVAEVKDFFMQLTFHFQSF